MKKAIVIATLFASVICSSLISSVAVADCGKMMVYPYRWRYRPQPPRQPMIYIVGNGNQIQVTNNGPSANNSNGLYATVVGNGNQVQVTNNPGTRPQLPKKCPWANQPQQPVQQTPGFQETPAQPDTSWLQDNSTQAGASAQTGNNSPVQQSGVKWDFETAIDSDNQISSLGTFEESSQRAVIAWNGFEDQRGEETLILTTNEKSRAGEDIPMLSVLPLPGMVLAIEEADPEVFNNARKLLYSKYPADEITYMGVIFEKKIGAHNIFVWELDNIETFKKEVNAYIAYRYNFTAAPLIDKKTEQTIGEYFKRGFRYFAFDLTEVKKEGADKVAISYRFKSERAYYPLQISAVGGTTTDTDVELIIISPRELALTGAVKVGDKGFSWTGNRSVNFTMAEVQGLDPQLAKVFGNSSANVTAREYIFSGTLNKFKNDFTARNAK
ncbi:MAG: hypothetical protein IKX40_13415 [Thermoguttaceae bacterium]|nr:hypothetical protein [Thermoguttaceae bacterium]